MKAGNQNLALRCCSLACLIPQTSKKKAALTGESGVCSRDASGGWREDGKKEKTQQTPDGC